MIYLNNIERKNEERTAATLENLDLTVGMIDLTDEQMTGGKIVEGVTEMSVEGMTEMTGTDVIEIEMMRRGRLREVHHPSADQGRLLGEIDQGLLAEIAEERAAQNPTIWEVTSHPRIKADVIAQGVQRKVHPQREVVETHQRRKKKRRKMHLPSRRIVGLLLLHLLVMKLAGMEFGCDN